MRRYDQVPWRSKHPLLNGHTYRVPLVEIRYTGLLVVKASMGMTDQPIETYETNHPAYGPVAMCNRKQGHYSNCRVCEVMIVEMIIKMVVLHRVIFCVQKDKCKPLYLFRTLRVCAFKLVL
jgi:hypothetical protein